MKSSGKGITLFTQMFVGKIFVGFCWVAAGVSGYADSIISHVLQILFLLGALLSTFVLLRLKKEESDEMAIANYVKAKATSSDIIHIVMCIATFLVPLLAMVPASETWNWPRVMAHSFFVLIGMQNLITGILFQNYEEN